MKPTQKVLNGHAAVKVAIVQTAPVFFDRERTIDKACLKIAEAASQGAQIIVFSEAWIAGYPYWGEGWESRVGDWMDVRGKFFDSTLLIDGDECARLCAAAAKANAVVVIGCNEMDPRPAVHTVYNSLLYIDNHGQILGRHRKMMPTFVERAVWGCGDGSDLQCFDTDFGRIGGLICGENLMTLARAHLIAQGRTFTCRSFPGAFALHTGPKLEEFDAEARELLGLRQLPQPCLRSRRLRARVLRLHHGSRLSGRLRVARQPEHRLRQRRQRRLRADRHSADTHHAGRHHRLRHLPGAVHQDRQGGDRYRRPLFAAGHLHA